MLLIVHMAHELYMMHVVKQFDSPRISPSVKVGIWRHPGTIADRSTVSFNDDYAKGLQNDRDNFRSLLRTIQMDTLGISNDLDMRSTAPAQYSSVVDDATLYGLLPVLLQLLTLLATI